MAVPPANGAIYLSKIALEKAYDNYAHSSAWTTLESSNNKISLKHVTIGGAPHAGYYNAGESPEGFETTNTTSPSSLYLSHNFCKLSYCGVKPQ